MFSQFQNGICVHLLILTICYRKLGLVSHIFLQISINCKNVWKLQVNLFEAVVDYSGVK